MRLITFITVFLLAMTATATDPKPKTFNFETDEVVVAHLTPMLSIIKYLSNPDTGLLIRLRMNFKKEIIKSGDNI